MDESKKSRPSQQPQRASDRAQDRRQQRRDYAAGADGEQDVTAGPTEAEETPRAKQERTRKTPDEQRPPHEQEVARGQADHSEREWGGDQDIDTAGMIPGNKATEDDEPTGQ